MCPFHRFGGGGLGRWGVFPLAPGSGVRCKGFGRGLCPAPHFGVGGVGGIGGWTQSIKSASPPNSSRSILFSSTHPYGGHRSGQVGADLTSKSASHSAYFPVFWVGGGSGVAMLASRTRVYRLRAVADYFVRLPTTFSE